MTKPLRESSTVQNAVASFIVLLLSTIISARDPDTGEFNLPGEADIAFLVTGGLTLFGTIQGRKRAVEPIGDPTADKFEPVVYEYPPIRDYPPNNEPLTTQELLQMSALEPDPNYVASLPSAYNVPEFPPSVLMDQDTIDNEEEDLEINLSNLKGKYYLVALQDTKLKTSTNQSNSLDTGNFVDIAKDKRVYVDYWKFLKEQNSHIEIGIDEYSNINNGVFYVHAPHFHLYNVSGNRVEIEVPTSPVPIIKKNLTPFTLPGNSSPFYLENPIYPGSHFTWSEATKNGQRIPHSVQIVDNIIKQARELDKLRSYLGNKSLVVTSWYRDPRTNAAVGGATNSAHLSGLATDILCPSMPIHTLQDKIINYWKVGGVGKGASKGFVHVASDGWYRVWLY